jgi:hypothetical protein
MLNFHTLNITYNKYMTISIYMGLKHRYGGYVEPQSGLYGICKLFFILLSFIYRGNQKQSLNNRKMSRCFATNQNNKIVDVERHDLQIPYRFSILS